MSFCEREGKEGLTARVISWSAKAPARWFGFVTEGCFKYVTYGISDDKAPIKREPSSSLGGGWKSHYRTKNYHYICTRKLKTRTKVNKAVGGVADSNHLTGCAADIRCVGVEQAIRYATLLLDISDMSREAFDELLIERSGRGGYWVHFAVRPHDNRRNISILKGG